jgi:DNA-binding CsgD family transcriptional regulator
MLDRLFEALAPKLDSVKHFEEGSSLLLSAASNYGLKHVAYLGINIPRIGRTTPFYSATYTSDWCKHYEHSAYVDIDPVVRLGLTGLLPIDWRSFDYSQPQIRRLFGEAEDFGLGRQGLTIPIRGRGPEVALFSVNSDLPDGEWADLKKQSMRDLQLLAHYFHQMVIRVEGGETPHYEARLSPREKECLQWAASGKTIWETAHILNVSERAVRLYLDVARHKLECLNKTQAVAKAVALGIIESC